MIQIIIILCHFEFWSGYYINFTVGLPTYFCYKVRTRKLRNRKMTLKQSSSVYVTNKKALLYVFKGMFFKIIGPKCRI